MQPQTFSGKGMSHLPQHSFDIHTAHKAQRCSTQPGKEESDRLLLGACWVLLMAGSKRHLPARHHGMGSCWRWYC
jgi:hypothetical protein